MTDEAPRSPEQTPDGWDAVTTAYEAAVESFTGHFAYRLLELVGVRAGDLILDVACGPGVLTLEAARRGARALGVDFSSAMVARLRRRAEEEDLGNVAAEVMDGQHLDLPDASFDSVFCNFGVIFFPDRDRGFAELYRVLKTGGTAAVTVWSTPDRLGFVQVVSGAVRRALPDLPAPAPPSWLEVATPTGLEESLRTAGFETVAVTTETGYWTVPSPQWLRDHFRDVSPASRMLLERLPAEGRERVLDEAAAILREQYGEGEAQVPAEAHLGIGRKAP